MAGRGGDGDAAWITACITGSLDFGRWIRTLGFGRCWHGGWHAVGVEDLEGCELPSLVAGKEEDMDDLMRL